VVLGADHGLDDVLNRMERQRRRWGQPDLGRDGLGFLVGEDAHAPVDVVEVGLVGLEQRGRHARHEVVGVHHPPRLPLGLGDEAAVHHGPSFGSDARRTVGVLVAHGQMRQLQTPHRVHEHVGVAKRRVGSAQGVARHVGPDGGVAGGSIGQGRRDGFQLEEDVIVGRVVWHCEGPKQARVDPLGHSHAPEEGLLGCDELVVVVDGNLTELQGVGALEGHADEGLLLLGRRGDEGAAVGSVPVDVAVRMLGDEVAEAHKVHPPRLRQLADLVKGTLVQVDDGAELDLVHAAAPLVLSVPLPSLEEQTPVPKVHGCALHEGEEGRRPADVGVAPKGLSVYGLRNAVCIVGAPLLEETEGDLALG